MSNILIVEDNAESRYMLERLLASRGHRITAAENGQDALRFARQDPPEVIISDIMMPVMNGFRLCREVKNDADLRNIPFIFYTATFVEKTDEKLAMSLGASRFVLKPAEGETFIRILDEVLNEHRDGILSIPEGPLAGEDILLDMYDASVTRKLAEMVERLQDERKALVKSEQRLKEAQELAHVGHWELDLKSNALEWSDEIYRILGLKPREIDSSHKAFMAVVHPDDMAYVSKAHTESLSKKTPYDIEYRLLQKDGTVRYINEKFQSLYDDDGTATCLMGTIQDITERREAEKALKEAYDIINRSSSVAFTWKNREGWPVVFVSENVERLFGYTVEEFMSGDMNYARCVHPEDLDRVTQEVTVFSNKRETNEFVHEPYRIMAKDGSEKFVRDWTYMIRDHEGHITHYKGIVKDITQSRRAEEEREKLQAQFYQSQKMESIGVLAGGVAHDFNNLLTAIIGNAELALADLPKDDPLRGDIEQIKKVGERGAVLTRRLLTFSRKETCHPEILDLNTVVRDMEKLLLRLFRENIKLRIVQTPGLWKVKADLGQTEQVIMNLAVNARDVMLQGGALTIETANVELDRVYLHAHGVEGDPGQYVMLAVTDTGCGMDEETKARIFEPFFTTKERGTGTGLGLSTVYGIVKQSKGYILPYSEPGMGTTMKVYLPRAETVPEALERQSSHEESGGGEVVLVVEDNASLRKLAGRALQSAGYEVLEAADGEEALRWIGRFEGDIHLLLTDMVMPGMGGKALSERALSLRPKMKVIYMSGYPNKALPQNHILESDISFIQKPFTLESLCRKVREAMDDEASCE